MAVNSLRGLNEALRSMSISPASASRTALVAATQRSPIFIPASFTRSMATVATEATEPTATPTQTTPKPSKTKTKTPEIWKPIQTVPLTIHAFPTLEPLKTEPWSTTHLHLPLRRDLLHLAVTYEASHTRQGTASSKTRYEVHGSHRKMRPQKGTGRARQGSRQSPLLRGGGKTFGPHPRDFGTDLNRKVYDKAWRTALSYRYRRGELIVCEDGMDLPLPEEFKRLVEGGFIKGELREGYLARRAEELVMAHGWGREFGRTLFVTKEAGGALFECVELAGVHGRALGVEDVDVKDLLTEGRVVVERGALWSMIEAHQSDLVGIEGRSI